MPLSKEQYLELRKKGLSNEQIVKFENQNTSKSAMKSDKSSVGNILGGLIKDPTGLSQVIPQAKKYEDIAFEETGQALTPRTGNMAIDLPSQIVKDFLPMFKPTNVALGAMLGGMGSQALTGAAKNPMTRRFMERQVPTFTKNILKETENFVKFPADKKKLDLALETRNALFNKKRAISEAYGKGRKEIMSQYGDETISMVGQIDDFADNAMEATKELSLYPDFRDELIKQSAEAKKIQKIFDAFDKNAPEEMTIKEADKLVSFIKNLPGVKTKLSQGYKRGFDQIDFTNSERILLELADNIQDDIINKAPGMANLKADYRVMSDIKKVRPFIKFGKTLNNLKNFHTLDEEIKQSFYKVMPTSTMNKIMGFNQAERMMDLLKKIGIAAALTGGAATGGYVGARTVGELFK